jgi:hypothetical protein
MQRRRRHAEDLGRLLDGQQVPVGALGRRLAPGNVAVAAQTPDVERRKAVPAGGAFALAIEDAGDHGVGVVLGEAADEREAVLVGPDPRWIRAGQTDIEFRDGVPTPAQREARAAFVTVDRNGVTQEELIEAITHLAFYAGWPSAVMAISVAKDVFQRQ